jgi:hypothetical protein
MVRDGCMDVAGGDWRWLQVVGGDWRWLEVVGGGWRWLEVVGGGWRWLEVVGGGWRWLEVGEVVKWKGWMDLDAFFAQSLQLVCCGGWGEGGGGVRQITA